MINNQYRGFIYWILRVSNEEKCIKPYASFSPPFLWGDLNARLEG